MLVFWCKSDHGGVVDAFENFKKRFNLDFLTGENYRIFLIKKDGADG